MTLRGNSSSDVILRDLFGVYFERNPTVPLKVAY